MLKYGNDIRYLDGVHKLSYHTQKQAKAAEAAVSKKRFEMARFDLVHHLSQLEIRKKHEVVGRTCRALYAFLELFRQRDDLVGSTEQHLVELEFALKRSREVGGMYVLCVCII